MFKIIGDLFIILILFRFILYFISKLVDLINKYNIKYKTNNTNYHNNKNSVKDHIKNLIKCNYCGIYIALEESIELNGKYFCCKEHAIN